MTTPEGIEVKVGQVWFCRVHAKRFCRVMNVIQSEGRVRMQTCTPEGEIVKKHNSLVRISRMVDSCHGYKLVGVANGM